MKHLPNILTVLRILITPLFLFCLFSDFHGSKYYALFLFIFASFTDAFDGYYARKHNIVSDLESKGTKVRRDAFGHVRLDEINPGKWYANKIAEWTSAKKVLVQKSGYFARSSAPNQNDITLINRISKKAVDYALDKRSGVAGLSDEHNQEIKCIDFTKIKGGKPFDCKQSWYQKILNEIGQKKG